MMLIIFYAYDFLVNTNLAISISPSLASDGSSCIAALIALSQ
jgi:hypothetical protein